MTKKPEIATEKDRPMTEKHRKGFGSVRDQQQGPPTPRDRQEINQHYLDENKKQKLPDQLNRDENIYSRYTFKRQVVNKIDLNKNKSRDSHQSRRAESQSIGLKSHEQQESPGKDRHNQNRHPYSPIQGSLKSNKNTDEMMKKYVEDILQTIPDSEYWQIPVRREARKKLRILVEEELKGKMIRPLNVA